MAARTPPVSQSPPVIRVTTNSPTGEQQELRFTSAFRIGRTDECHVTIRNEYVSRAHAEVSFANGRWCVRDLGSANGIFVNGSRVPEAAIEDALTIRLGVEGPFVSFAIEVPAPPPAPPVEAGTPPPGNTALYAAHYFRRPADGDPVGMHTQMVRRAFQQVQKKQKRRHYAVVGGLLVLVAAVGAYAYFQHVRIAQQTATAKELFYAMKSLRVDIATVEQLVRESGNRQAAEQVQKYQSRQHEMEKNYDRFLTSLRIYDPKMTEEQRLVLRVARIFGECELEMPPGFADEVRNYIKKWQSSPRLAKAVRTASNNGYIQRITRELLGQNLRRSSFTSRCRKATSTRSSADRPPTRESPRACGSSSPKLP